MVGAEGSTAVGNRVLGSTVEVLESVSDVTERPNVVSVDRPVPYVSCCLVGQVPVLGFHDLSRDVIV